MQKRGPNKLATEVTDKVQQQIFAGNEYELIETDTRNVLICGRTRSGKTTAIGLLKDPCLEPEPGSIFSGTINTKFQSFSIKNKKPGECEFTINVIDTPGTFEVVAEGADMVARTNDIITDTIGKCLDYEITNLHAIILFVSFEAGINPHDIESIKIFLQMFGSVDKTQGKRQGVKIALCITRADNHDENWRNNIASELTRHAELSSLIENESLDILFMGVVDIKSGKYKRADDLWDAYVEMYSLREQMLNYIFSSKNRVQLSHMPVAHKKINLLKLKLNEATANFNYFNTVKDFAIQQTQVKMISHKECVNFITANKAFINLADIAQDYIHFTSALNDFKAGPVPEPTKAEILGALADPEPQAPSS